MVPHGYKVPKSTFLKSADSWSQLVATTNDLVKEDRHSCTTKTLILLVTYSQHSIELSTSTSMTMEGSRAGVSSPRHSNSEKFIRCMLNPQCKLQAGFKNRDKQLCGDSDQGGYSRSSSSQREELSGPQRESTLDLQRRKGSRRCKPETQRLFLSALA